MLLLQPGNKVNFKVLILFTLQKHVAKQEYFNYTKSMNFLIVALGGAIGAAARYGLSLITVKIDFPLMTFITNLLGAFAIGLIVGFAAKKNLDSRLILFLKTGFCGGFTTFSTFSLETFNLIQAGNYFIAGLYALLSLVLCIAGVALGLLITK